MKTAISLPDPTFRRVNQLAKKLGISRSEVFVRAVEEYLERRDAAEIVASYDRAFSEEAEDPAEQRFRRAAARRALEQVEW